MNELRRKREKNEDIPLENTKAEMATEAKFQVLLQFSSFLLFFTPLVSSSSSYFYCCNFELRDLRFLVRICGFEELIQCVSADRDMVNYC